jgi:[ribosomal protein S18]-alanine N-acetyltransferase
VSGGGEAPEIVIEPLRPEDLAAVSEIESMSFPTPWTLSSFRYEMNENPYASLFGVRLAGGPIVGFGCVWVVDQELRINNLAIHPRYRSRGLGGRLLDALVAFGAGQGCMEATLEVRPSNGAALRIYGRAGFRVVGRRRGYYSDTQEDALVMSLRFPPRPRRGGTLAPRDPGC